MSAKFTFTANWFILLFTTVSINASTGKQIPLPSHIEGMDKHQIVLNGTWQFDMYPGVKFENAQYKPDKGWKNIQVPGECAMQGFAIEHEKPVLYRKSVDIPASFTGKDIILRFDGVYSYARLFVNGSFVREHHGGFTRWESDITPFIKTGKKNEIKLEVTDRKDDISYGSGYAHHPIGGILRDVMIYALPKNHIEGFIAETLLDSTFRDAILNLSFDVKQNKDAKLKIKLTAPDARTVVLTNADVLVPAGTKTVNHRIPVKNPLKWDAEHPHLYTLQVSYLEDGKETYSFSRQIGFRDIKIEGNRMLVNGKQVKLRGACRHDVHPTLGRIATAEYDSLDAVLFKKSNMNFVRTSHYPPSERFLEYCDKYGIYVECETAICFVDTYRQKNYAPGKSQNDSTFTDRYLSQLQEMVSSLRNHTSILFWSVGNECVYGTNFQQSYNWVKKADTTRPAIFSYPGTVPTGQICYDIISMHYPGVDGNMNQMGVQTAAFQTQSHPSLFDEWAHVPCYTYSTLQDDPNIREFWGISLDKMWGNLFKSPGGLGGAIWGFIDETFMLPVPTYGSPWWIEYAKTAKPAAFAGNCVGYGEWGIIDVWRREKPEFWSTKKAYSPIRLEATSLQSYSPGYALLLPVYNRFDHTNLNEVTVRCTFKNQVSTTKGPDVAPHARGTLSIPAAEWEKGQNVIVEFLSEGDELIDAYTVSLDYQDTITQDNNSGNLQIKETATETIIEGDGFTIPFNHNTGLITNATSNNEIILKSGPFLNLDLNFNHKTGAEVREKASNLIVNEKDWVKSSFSTKKESNRVTVLLSGTYKNIKTDFTINIFPSGEMTVDYITHNEPNGWLREAGVKFLLTEQPEHLEWNRQPYWSFYPEGHFAGKQGSVPLYNKKTVKYGADPKQDWNMDTHNYYYFADAGSICKRPLTNIAKGMKENIYTYTLLTPAKKGKLQAVSPHGNLACRINKDTSDQLILYINTRWDYPEIAWGDYCKALEVSPCYGKITLRFK